jgi:hypothetical protein
MGISFGGLAAYIAGFDRELRDPRIQIAITMAASGGDRLAPRYFDFVERSIPLFLIHGTIDALIEFESTSFSESAEGAVASAHGLALGTPRARRDAATSPLRATSASAGCSSACRPTSTY